MEKSDRPRPPMETGKCAICQAGVEWESVSGAGEWVRWDKNVCVVFWSRLVNGEEKAKEERGAASGGRAEKARRKSVASRCGIVDWTQYL